MIKSKCFFRRVNYHLNKRTASTDPAWKCINKVAIRSVYVSGGFINEER